MYKKVLIPLDGSKMAECTLAHVLRLSKLGAIGELTLLQVVESPGSAYWATGATNLIEQLEAEIEQHAKAYLSEVQAGLVSEGIESTSEVLVSFDPAAAIVQYAQENAMDLIVLASQGHSGVVRWVFGSVALKVLHDTTIPVFLVRPKLEDQAAV
jgi:nucleotide-binding universal stress UspA family protein